MAGIDKVLALVKIAEAMEVGDYEKVGKMNKVYSKAILNEGRNSSYQEKIELTKDEKKLFNYKFKAY